MDKILTPIDNLVSNIGKFFISRPRLAASSVLLLILMIFFIGSFNDSPNKAQKITIPPIPTDTGLENPPETGKSVLEANNVAKAPEFQEVEVKKGDTLAQIFKREHIPAKDLQKIVALGPKVKTLKRLKPGETLLIQTDTEQGLLLLQYKHDGRWLVVERQEKKFVARWQDQAAQTVVIAPEKEDILNDVFPDNPATAAPQIEEDAAPDSPWLAAKVQAGQNLSDIFAQLNLSATDLHRIMAVGKNTRPLKKIKPNQSLYFMTDADHRLQKMVYVKDEFNALIITRASEKKFRANWQPVPKDIAQLNKAIPTPPVTETESHEVTQVFAASTGDDHLGTASGEKKSLVKSGFQFLSGKVQSSLSRDAKRAGLGEKQIQELVGMFRNINLKKLSRSGDFRVLKASTGEIVAAELTYNGKTYQVVRFTDPKGRTNYYTPDGRNIQQSLSRAPLKYTYISSRFSRHRWQPILGFFRPHLGVDYVAPQGTPIKAAGEGKIIFMGTKSGYGKTIILKHANQYSTLYAHLSRYGKDMRVGKYVTAKDTIGYVGRTGLATGSHLHYEIHRRNVAENPLTVPLPGGTVIAKAYRKDFFANVKVLTDELNVRKQEQEQANQVKLTQQNAVATQVN